MERPAAEACAIVELIEGKEPELLEIERKEQLFREQRARRQRKEREQREFWEADSWRQQQDSITASSQWFCKHYQWHCSVKFPCCMQFYSCHHCHNISTACDNEEAKACHATHLKCCYCQHEQKVSFYSYFLLQELKELMDWRRKVTCVWFSRLYSFFFGSKWSFKKFSSLNHNSPALVLVCLLLVFKRIVVYFGINLFLFKFLEIICLEFQSNFKLTYY